MAGGKGGNGLADDGLGRVDGGATARRSPRRWRAGVATLTVGALAAVLTVPAHARTTEARSRPVERSAAPGRSQINDPTPAGPRPTPTTPGRSSGERSASGGGAGAATGPSCAPAEHPGGDWPSLNGDAQNTREQRAVRTLPSGSLRPAWSFAAEEVGATGGMRSTPIVANGCVFLGFGQGYLGDRGDVVALNADTGELVWHVRLEGSVLGLAVANGMVYATPSLGTRGELALPVVTDAYEPAGSYAVALDTRTGERRWTSERLDDGNPANGTFINASPVAYEAGGRPLLFVPLSGGSGDGARVPMYFLDAQTGATVKRAHALTEAEYEAGFGGTGIWSTAAYDPATQQLYAGTADSDGHRRQHPYNNALLQIDAHPGRPTFGSVLGAYSGTTEHANLDALIGHPNNPLCGGPDELGIDLPTFFDTSASVQCLELDFDFGGSPNLYRDDRGRMRVGALQKSGLYHSVDASTMTASWTFLVGPGGPVMDGATAAVGTGDVFVGATPNLVYRLRQDDGLLRWVGTTGLDMFAYQPLTVADGVVYGITDAGFLVGLDAASGLPRLHRLLSADGGFDSCLGVGAGVAVARATLYAPCDSGGLADLAGLPGPGGGLVAYR